VADVLVVTSTVRVLDGVHRHTTDLRPAVALDAVLVEGTAGLQQRLVNAATAGDDADRRARARVHKLLLPRGQAQARLAHALDVANDLREAARRARELRAIAGHLLDLVDHRTGRHGLERQDVARNELGCEARLGASEGTLSNLELGCTTARCG